MLSFTHAGNRLSSVQSWDGASLPQIGTFTYDAMGNRLTDSRQGLQMEYNLLNLPREARHMNDTVSYRYLADGKEEQRFGANPITGSAGMDIALSDFGARYYDPVTCRWTTRDPLAGKYLSLSPYNYCAGNPVACIDSRGDSLKFLSSAAILAMYNGIAPNTQVSLSFKDGVLLPSSIPDNLDDFFIKDLKEMASSSVMVTVDVSDQYLYSDYGQRTTGRFETAPYDYDDTQDALDFGFESFGKTIQGNLGQTLLPVRSKKGSIDDNVNIILNSKGSLNHQTVGMAHEFGHAILYLRGKPSGHGDPGVDNFVYSRASAMSKRLGYDR